MAKEKKVERRRFEDTDRKPWTDEERAKYEARRSALAPLVRDLTTPARKEKEKTSDPLAELLGIED
jgi:hypothetical protein